MIRVAHAVSADTKALAEFLQEVDIFYGEASNETLESKLENINSALFADPPRAYALLAWDDSNLVGFASYSVLWPAVMSTKSLYLKELYVRTTSRRSGIGRLLMADLFRVALDEQCSRVEWTTDQDNSDAQAFYERLGVSVSPSKLFYRADKETLRSIRI